MFSTLARTGLEMLMRTVQQKTVLLLINGVHFHSANLKYRKAALLALNLARLLAANLAGCWLQQ